MPDRKNSELAERIRQKVAEELKKRGLDPNLVSTARVNMPSEKEDKDSCTGSDFTYTEAESTQAEDKVVRSKDRTRREADEDFWNLGKPKERSYSKPDFGDESLTLSDVVGATGNFFDSDEAHGKTRQSETIPERKKNDYPSQTMNPMTTLHEQRHYTTRSYRRPQRTTVIISSQNTTEAPPPVTYDINGALIKRITVESRSGNNDFYTRFAADAQKSHAASPKYPDAPLEPVQFYSLVPQYSHMTASQLEYYKRIRELWRRGEFPDCDSAYVMLYVYELLNLDGVDDKTVAELLASIWLGYRKRFPKLDSCMCDYMQDFCMIHNIPFPEKLMPSITEIIANAHFKEYYMNCLLSLNDGYVTAADAFISGFSDYDYKRAKYYPENRTEYEKHIKSAVGEVIRYGIERKFAIFGSDKVLSIPIDSYIGAVVSSTNKKRMRVEFTSFLKGIEVREYATAVVKHAENKLRLMLGIKAKLGEKPLDSETLSAIDMYFKPLMPAEKVKVRAEDKYMPADYMKNYEAESWGFDFAEAAEIERESWANTARLTVNDEENGETAIDATKAIDTAEVVAEVTKVAEIAEETEITEKVEFTQTESVGNEENNDEFMKNSVRAALDGRFVGWAKSVGLYEGEAQDRVNTYFLDIIGDVILEEYTFIEDYREDIEEWMK